MRGEEDRARFAVVFQNNRPGSKAGPVPEVLRSARRDRALV
jgi:hypothetical protein